MIVANIPFGRICSNDEQWEHPKFKMSFGVTVCAGVCVTDGAPSHVSIEFPSEYIRPDFSGCGQPYHIGPSVKMISS